MVKYSGAELDATFGALADATRRAILARLALGETSVSEIAAPFVRSEGTRRGRAFATARVSGNQIPIQDSQFKIQNANKSWRGAKTPEFSSTGDAPMRRMPGPGAGRRMSLVAVAKHLRVLEGAGLVRTEKDGRVRRCQLVPAPLRDAAEWIRFYQQFWEDQFDALERYIEEVKKEDPSWRPQPTSPESESKSDARSPRRARKCFRPGPTRRS